MYYVIKKNYYISYIINIHLEIGSTNSLVVLSGDLKSLTHLNKMLLIYFYITYLSKVECFEVLPKITI